MEFRDFLEFLQCKLQQNKKTFRLVPAVSIKMCIFVDCLEVSSILKKVQYKGDILFDFQLLLLCTLKQHVTAGFSEDSNGCYSCQS